jgi:hypothetical protein
MKIQQTALVALLLVGSPFIGMGEEHESKKVMLPTLSSMQDVVNSVAYFQREVDEHIESKQLDELHGYAFAASDAAAKAKDFATSLGADKVKELNEHLARIKSISKQLDKYGDAGKADESKQFSAKLKSESEAVQKLVGVTASTEWKPAGSADDHESSGSKSNAHHEK